ncbi:MAG: ester cyclase [Halobacteriaceae archaeon]
MADPDLPARVERALATFNEGDLDGHMDLFAPGGTFRDPVLDDPVSGDAHRAYLHDVYEAFPDIHQEAERAVTGDGRVAFESTFTGTHEGPIEGIPPTGASVSVPLASVVEFTDDGITDWRDYWDQSTFRAQLGLTFPDVVALLPRLAAARLRGT